jgi:hypothetical protein
MAIEVLPNRTTSVSAATTLTELRLYSTWLLIWWADGKQVFLVTGDAEEGAAVPTNARRIPANAMPFSIDVSAYDGAVFLAASESCTVVVEGRE